MAGELNIALNAINTPLDTKQRKHEDLSMLFELDKRIEADNQKEAAAQLAYSEYESSVNKFSESLLENDRSAIRTKASDLQSQIKNEIKKFGGSYKQFMENGGVRMIAKYKDMVVNSKEAQIYADNAKNMAHIIKARDAGKGGLISATDLKALQDYEKNGYGQLTYSGLLSEIEMPDAMAYEFGTNIPAQDILENKNNYSAILSNFMREHPDEGMPTVERLTEYTDAKYGGKGKNYQITMYKQKMAQANREAAAKNKGKAQKRVSSLYTNGREAMNQMNGAGLDGQETGFKATDNIQDVYKRGKHMKGIVTGREFNDVSETIKHGLGFDLLSSDTSDTRLKGARIHGGFEGGFKSALQKLESDRYNEDSGTYKFNSNEMFGADGTKMKTDEDLQLKPVTVVWAGMGKGKNILSDSENNEEFLLVEFSDEDGNLDEKQNKQYTEGLGDTSIYMRPVEVFKDEDSGHLYYRPMPMDSASYESAYTESIQEIDDNIEQVEADQQMGRDKMGVKLQVELRKQEAQRKINNSYQSEAFQKSVDDKIINKHSFPNNQNIFYTMSQAFAMANKAITSGDPTAVPEINSSEVDMANDYLGNVFSQEALTKLQNKNLTMEQAYMQVAKDVRNAAKVSGSSKDMQESNMFLTYWKSLYETKTGRKLKLK